MTQAAVLSPGGLSESMLPATLVALLALLGQSCDSGVDCDFSVESCISQVCKSDKGGICSTNTDCVSNTCRGGRCCKSYVDTNCATCGERGYCEECSGDLYADGSFATSCTAKKAGGEALPFCFTKCDGCGHCGAGVPASKRECFDKSDAFVDGVLEKWRRGE